MRTAQICLLALIGCGLAGFAAVEARAQPAGLSAGRDCQVVRACNYGRGGPYRGCVSTYTCRVCRFVRVSCKGLRGGSCQKLRCGWGGVS